MTNEQTSEQPKKKNWFAQHKVLTVIIVLFVIGLIGMATGSNAPTQQTTNTNGTNQNNPTTQATPKKAEPKKTTFAVGETIKLDNHELVVNSVNKNFKTDNIYSKPENPENSFVSVNVTITNTGKDDLPINMFGFKLEDETGTQRNTSYLSGLNSTLESATLSPNGKNTGNLGFEAKAGSKTLKLHYTGGFFGGGEIIVNL